MFVFSFQIIPKTENYFDKLFPKIAALALKLPEQVKKVSLEAAQSIQLSPEDNRLKRSCCTTGAALDGPDSFRMGHCLVGKKLLPNMRRVGSDPCLTGLCLYCLLL